MNSKKKFTVAILALALVAVAAVTSVIAVLAATSTTVTNSFTITYTATNQVNAVVYSGYNKGTLNAASANTIYTQIGSSNIEFAPSANTTAETSQTGGSATFNLANSGTEFAVFKFSFTNRSSIAANTLTATLNSTSVTAINGITNTKSYYRVSSDENNLDSSINIASNNGDIVTTGYTALDSNCTVQIPSNTGANENKNIRYVYLLIFIDDVEQGVSASNVAISWDLTAAANN